MREEIKKNKEKKNASERNATGIQFVPVHKMYNIIHELSYKIRLDELICLFWCANCGIACDFRT